MHSGSNDRGCAQCTASPHAVITASLFLLPTTPPTYFLAMKSKVGLSAKLRMRQKRLMARFSEMGTCRQAGGSQAGSHAGDSGYVSSAAHQSSALRATATACQSSKLGSCTIALSTTLLWCKRPWKNKHKLAWQVVSQLRHTVLTACTESRQAV